ncbi:MAG: gluconate 2-dehydrogenase subunit 3 family protein [Cyclobacteriaceae bacterium]|nr:gluconate 2-dehydrogenase subunit 3 family protein [Cyclobacteriaceae bacterium]
MDRREALTATAWLFGSAIVGGAGFLSACNPTSRTGATFREEDLSLLDEVGETILPATASSPGAKAAGIAAFMHIIVRDCYSDDEQSVFFSGIGDIDLRAKKQYGKTFRMLSPEEKHRMVVQLDVEAKQKQEGIPHYFTLMKQLTIWGYFSSEPGCTRALRYVPVPGRYKGCVPYTKGEGAWS